MADSKQPPPPPPRKGYVVHYYYQTESILYDSGNGVTSFVYDQPENETVDQKTKRLEEAVRKADTDTRVNLKKRLGSQTIVFLRWDMTPVT